MTFIARKKSTSPTSRRTVACCPVRRARRGAVLGKRGRGGGAGDARATAAPGAPGPALPRVIRSRQPVASRRGLTACVSRVCAARRLGAHVQPHAGAGGGGPRKGVRDGRAARRAPPLDLPRLHTKLHRRRAQASHARAPRATPGYIPPGDRYAGQEKIKLLVRSELVRSDARARESESEPGTRKGINNTQAWHTRALLAARMPRPRRQQRRSAVRARAAPGCCGTTQTAFTSDDRARFALHYPRGSTLTRSTEGRFTSRCHPK
jgi:hypothetical protein